GWAEARATYRETREAEERISVMSVFPQRAWPAASSAHRCETCGAAIVRPAPALVPAGRSPVTQVVRQRKSA
ncbi:MAG: hypothetical protein WA979_12195, partial [Pacificimonas sp.]